MPEGDHGKLSVGFFIETEWNRKLFVESQNIKMTVYVPLEMRAPIMKKW